MLLAHFPTFSNAIKITSEDQEDEIKATLTQKIDLVLEAMQHMGNNVVRCVAMSSTDGLRRGMRALIRDRRSGFRWAGDPGPAR